MSQESRVTSQEFDPEIQRTKFSSSDVMGAILALGRPGIWPPLPDNDEPKGQHSRIETKSKIPRINLGSILGLKLTPQAGEVLGGQEL